MAAWLEELGVELVVMENTGIHSKNVFAHLERAGIPAWGVNAHFIVHVPGRKSGMADSAAQTDSLAQALRMRISGPRQALASAKRCRVNRRSTGPCRSGRL